MIKGAYGWGYWCRFIRTGYGKTIVGFFLWQVAFVLLARTDYFIGRYEGRNPDDMLTVSLFAAVNFVLLINTGIFIKEAGRVLGPLVRSSELEEKHKNSAEWSYNAFVTFLVAAAATAGALALFITLGGLSGLDSRHFPWPGVLRIGEFASLIIFMWFFLASIAAQYGCRLVLRETKGEHDGNRKRLEQMSSEIRLLFLTVDCPGLFGLLFILFISHVLYPGSVPYYYWHGFIAGAIALHVAFSQLALALVAARDEGSVLSFGVPAKEPDAQTQAAADGAP